MAESFVKVSDVTSRAILVAAVANLFHPVALGVVDFTPESMVFAASAIVAVISVVKFMGWVVYTIALNVATPPGMPK